MRRALITLLFLISLSTKALCLTTNAYGIINYELDDIADLRLVNTNFATSIAKQIADDTTVSNGVTTAFGAADTVVSNGVTTAFGAADTVVSNGVTTAFGAADTVVSNGVTTAFTSADTVVSNGVTTAYVNADTVVSNGLTSAYTSADTAVSNGVTTAFTSADTIVSNGVTTAFGAADTVVSNGVTTAFIAADTVVSNGVTTAYIAADTVVSNGVSTAFVAADTVVSNGVVAGYVAADTVVSNGVTSAFGAADTVVSNGVTTAYIAADTVVSNGVVSGYTAADTVVSNALQAQVTPNTTHRSSDGTDHANVVLNDTHRASDGKDHSDVVLNNTHRTSDGSDHTFIDQDVTSGSSPTFNLANMTNVAGLATNTPSANQVLKFTSADNYRWADESGVGGGNPIDGRAATNNVNMGGFAITNAADPVADQDVVTKAYGDANYTSGASQTPWTSNIDGAAYSLTNATDVTTTNGVSLAGIEAGAEVNNISDANATDLTDAGDSTLHYHATDRARANHTGTQAASTISDFDAEVANNTTVASNTTHKTSDGKDHSDVVLNNTHRTSNGSDHTFLDQSVVIGSSPTFNIANMTNWATIATNTPSANDVLKYTSGDNYRWATDESGGGGGSQTPWTNNVNGAGYGLSNAVFYGVAGDTNTYFSILSSTQAVLRLDGSNIYFNKEAEYPVNSPWQGNVDANSYSLTGLNDVTMDSGNTLNNPYGFSVTKSSVQSINATTYTLVTWDGEVHDVGSGFDLATETFTPPINGRYLMTAAVECDLSSDGRYTQFAFYTNGVGHAYFKGEGSAASSDAQATGSAILDLTTNDAVTVYGYQSTGVSKNIKATPYTFWQGVYIGE